MQFCQKYRLAEKMDFRAWLVILGLALALAIVAVVPFGCGPTSPGGIGLAGTDGPSSAQYFHDWPADRKPDLVLVLSAQQHGYLQPCGCSYPQFGGLERRYNLLQHLKKDKGWPLVAVDLGDIPQERGPQRMLKYVTSMEADKVMGYSAVGIGQFEAQLPLIDGLAEFALNNVGPPRVLAANLQNRKKDYAGMVDGLAFAGGENGVPKVGITAVVGPTVAKAVAPFKVNFDPVNQSLPPILAEFQKEKTEFQVLLFQGSEQEAKACAQEFTRFQVILRLTEEEEPPEKPVLVGNTRVIGVGHKGRYVGVVGFFRTGRPSPTFDMYYQLMKLAPEYETPPGKDADNPVLGILEGYSQKVRNENYLANYPQAKHPVQIAYPDAKYVGSDKCKKCHEHAYAVWQKSKHAHAFQSLVAGTRPSLRQFDGECVVCHVTGFEYQTGYRNETDTPLFKNVGCESCHGPGSEHAIKKNRSAKLLALMNPYKVPANETDPAKKRRLLGMHDSCTHCHDVDNDVNWNKPPAAPNKPPTWFTSDWGKIIHMTPKALPAGAGKNGQGENRESR
jgi:hypothetical protein